MLLFFFGMTAIRWATRWYGFKYGYEKGTQIVTEAGGSVYPARIDCRGVETTTSTQTTTSTTTSSTTSSTSSTTTFGRTRRKCTACV